MEVKYGSGTSEYGPGVRIELTGVDLAKAIDSYIVAHGIHVNGSRTISINGDLCREGHIYVDPSGFVIDNGVPWSGRGVESDEWKPTAEENEEAKKFFGITEVSFDASSLIKVSDFVNVKIDNYASLIARDGVAYGGQDVRKELKKYHP